MRQYQREFLELVIARQALRFGSFTLKSGRESPYFFNAGLLSDGAALASLGDSYAAAIIESGVVYDQLFGPAYKGIPLVSATAIALARHHARSVPFAFNRKEAKDHGEGGSIIGTPLAGRVLIVDDVITAGTAIRESIELIRATGATPAGVVLALDRQERGQGPLSAVQEVQTTFSIPVIRIVTLDDLIEHLAAAGRTDEFGRLREYRQRHGVAAEA
ncbi:MAG: orotate phosphoribosyltransferase [Gammaproteobacteria bacterium]|jgi:orotate phosphoribosyltransferase|nr:MAG: orotate phosphoribosyltransferase [Gammaproteobacteria bacterium]